MALANNMPMETDSVAFVPIASERKDEFPSELTTALEQMRKLSTNTAAIKQAGSQLTQISKGTSGLLNSEKIM